MKAGMRHFSDRGAFAAVLGSCLLLLAACSSSSSDSGSATPLGDPPADPPGETPAAGLLIVGWEADRGAVPDLDIHFARSTDGGTTWSAPAALNTNAAGDGTTDNDGGVNFATDGKGVWIAIWESIDDSGTDLDIYYARSADDGVTWSAPQPLNTDAGVDSDVDEDPDIVTDGQGNWIAAWEATAVPNLFYSTSTDNGETWSATQLLSDVDISQENVTLATDRAGRWVAVWEADVSDSDIDIVARVSTNAGLTWTPPVLSEPLPITSSISANDQDPHLETDGDGVWVIAWRERLFVEEFPSIFFSRSEDHASSWSIPAPLHVSLDPATSSNGEINHNGIATDGAGSWVAVWESTNDFLGGSGDYEVLFSRSTDHGATWSAPARVNTDGAAETFSDRAPTIAFDATGRFVVAWQSNRLGANAAEMDLFTAYSEDGGATWTVPALLNLGGDGDGLPDLDNDPVLKAK